MCIYLNLSYINLISNKVMNDLKENQTDIINILFAKVRGLKKNWCLKYTWKDKMINKFGPA